MLVCAISDDGDSNNKCLNQVLSELIMFPDNISWDMRAVEPVVTKG